MEVVARVEEASAYTRGTGSRLPWLVVTANRVGPYGTRILTRRPCRKTTSTISAGHIADDTASPRQRTSNETLTLAAEQGVRRRRIVGLGGTSEKWDVVPHRCGKSAPNQLRVGSEARSRRKRTESARGNYRPAARSARIRKRSVARGRATCRSCRRRKRTEYPRPWTWSVKTGERQVEWDACRIARRQFRRRVVQNRKSSRRSNAKSYFLVRRMRCLRLTWIWPCN